MDIKEIRKRNFELLLESFDPSVIAERCEWENRAYVYQIKNGHANMGHRTARKIEAAFPGFGKGPHWMDVPQWSEDPKDEVKREVDKVHPSQVQTLLLFLKSLNAASDDKDKPEPP
jgi:hypothetical protein